MEMQCSRLMKNVWGDKVDEKGGGTMAWHWQKKTALTRGSLASLRGLGGKVSWWKPLQCVLIQKFGDAGLNYEQ